ncbi:MAG: phage head morphogenesis protein, partial [Lactococcus lactis]|nr:phage head morphogenesis protein [Lactococcus lactis]
DKLNKDYSDYQKWSKAKFPSEKSFNGHFKSHGDDFPGISQAEYLKLAQDLLAQPISDTIAGYETEKGRRVRYDIEKNIFTTASDNKIRTLFKPKEGKGYFYDDYKKEYPE